MHMFRTQWFRSLRRCSLRGPSQECRDTHRAGLQAACLEVAEVASITGGGRNDMLDMDFPLVLKVLGQKTFI